MTLARSHVHAALGIAALGLASACGGSQPPEQNAEQFQSETPPPAQPPPPMETSATPPPAPSATAAAEAPPAPPVEQLSDAQIAAILTAANTGEMEQAKVAQKNARDPKVKQFAAHMITDHGQNNGDAQKLATKIGLVPAESKIQKKLVGDSAQLISRLEGMKGGDFDRDYIDAQVREHQDVLDLMDQKLIPQAQNPELKAAIQAFRPKVEHHLTEAKDIQAALQSKK